MQNRTKESQRKYQIFVQSTAKNQSFQDPLIK